MKKDDKNNKYIQETLELKKQIAELTKENKSLKRVISSLSCTQQNLENSRRMYLKLQEDFEKENLEKEKEINGLKNKIETIEQEKIKLIQEYRENIDSFSLNKNIIHQLELENKTFKEENDLLKLNQKTLMADYHKQIEEIKTTINSKFYTFKKKILNNLKQNKKSLDQVNFIHNDISNNIISLQNSNLLVDLEVLQTEVENLRTKNIDLTKKNNELLSDIEINKKVQYNLAKKMNDSEIIQTGVNLSKDAVKTDSNYFNDYNIFSNRNSMYTNGNLSKSNDKKIYNKNDFSSINFRKSSENKYPLINIISPESRKNKYKDMLFEKDKKIENIQQKYEIIHSKFQYYFNKYQRIISFLEDSINSFFNDEMLRKNERIQLNIENVKKLNFEVFNEKEKYTILIVLIKHILPLVTFNYKTKLPLDEKLLEEIAAADLNHNNFANYTLRNDSSVRKTFCIKNNSTVFKKTLLLRTNHNLIPFLRGRNDSSDLKPINNKFKAVE